MRTFRVHNKSVVLVLNKTEATAVAKAVSSQDGNYCDSLVEGKTTRDIRSKLEDALVAAGVPAIELYKWLTPLSPAIAAELTPKEKQIG